jgi:uncharacterized protein (DUF2141 family)
MCAITPVSCKRCYGQAQYQLNSMIITVCAYLLKFYDLHVSKYTVKLIQKQNGSTCLLVQLKYAILRM